jgi:hypothetical protein
MTDKTAVKPTFVAIDRKCVQIYDDVGFDF